VALSTDFYLVGLPVFVLDVLHGPPWLPGALPALSTTANATCGTLALRATRGMTRVAAMTAGAAVVVGWCVVCLATPAVSAGWLPPVLLATAVLFAAASLLFGGRVNALAVDLAPAAARGRYLATFQYAFTVPGVVAPAVVALFSVAAWLPWLVVGGCAALATAGLRRFA
jgi:hypothetical protein